jgi:hypothetical protein
VLEGCFFRVPFGGKDDASGLVCRGRLRAAINPDLEVLDAINHAAADLGVSRASSVGPVLFERAP